MTLNKPVYMDNHATTAVDPRVVEAMLPTFNEIFGNSASRNHQFGWAAEELVDQARGEVAALIGAKAKEIVWTSGATESDNLAIKGVAEFHKDKGRHIVTCLTEHKAVLDACKHLEKEGWKVTYLEPDETGQVSAAVVGEALRDDTVLVSLMGANNEIGTIHPVAEIGAVCRERGVFFHCDGAQLVGKEPVDVEAMNIDLLSISGHKLYGPKGIGALYVCRKPRVRIASQMDGGGHERGMRSGTINVSGVVGLGTACRIAGEDMEEETERLMGLRERLHKGIAHRISDIKLNGHPTDRLAGNLNISFAFVEGEALLMGVDDIALSSGSACTSASLEPSYVLRAIGVGDDLAHSSLRFGLGRFNTEEEVDYTIERVAGAVERLREMSPLWEMAQEGIDPSTVEWASP
jgi:cysteine desulfurase